MSEKKFSKKHEWVSLDGDVATVGITKHATEMLGDIVFVGLPHHRFKYFFIWYSFKVKVYFKGMFVY